MNHIHRLKKINLTRNPRKEPFIVYKCTKAACNYYIRLDLSEGILCECNVCGETMVITKSVLTRSNGGPAARPRCADCIKRKKAEDVESIAAFLEEAEKKTGTE